jgi:AcrR family transcriptional regulator
MSADTSQAEENPILSPKTRQILGGARETFLDLGFEGASVDEIARRAGVSKGTLYNHFDDKRSLFAAVIDRECKAQAERIFTIGMEEDDVETALGRIGRHYLDFLLSPSALALFRITVAESERFPRVGRAFWDSGPDLGTRRLAQFLAVAVSRGRLAIDDLDLAAHQFTELCKAELFYKTLLGVIDAPDEAARSHHVDAAVKVFLRAFGSPPSEPPR